MITGANSGIGFEAARMLAERGDHVVMAVRDRGRGEAARASILQASPGARVDLELVDLGDLDAVRALGARAPKLDVLVNNAGLGTIPLARTKEGVYLQFGANHLGHFLLTALLLKHLEGGADPRVVTVSSGLARKGTLKLDNLDGSRGYTQGGAYVQSKLANSLFAAELDRRLRARGSAVKSVVAHPGIAATPLQTKPTGLMGVGSRLVSALFGRPAAEGALPTVHAIVGQDVQGGEAYGPGSKRGAPPQREAPWPAFADRASARALWERSEALAQVSWL
ncbi:Short-chain dehydrogenase/reductase (SDR) superfamily protein [Chondromyces apiculatus DSM 436]|uniref:Short-chain dehydrogenase/reductase (SDR) superfamily protein n=2 Tax=Chondromyces apiculatus TaxID=51 RepID=A0A017SXR4_9BACT|nr:Short-chain dehydrogenase/reductase (SDR) superfamily protein [Chondromyces apiculatus DSM 436]